MDGAALRQPGRRGSGAGGGVVGFTVGAEYAGGRDAAQGAMNVKTGLPDAEGAKITQRTQKNADKFN